MGLLLCHHKVSASVDTNKALKEHMKQAGDCLYAEINRKGEGGAAFRTPEECQKALSLNGSVFNGHTLQVDVWVRKEKEPAA